MRLARHRTVNLIGSYHSGQFFKIPFRTYVRLLDSLEFAVDVQSTYKSHSM